MKRILIFLVSLGVFIGVMPSWALTIGPVAFNELHQEGELILPLRGVGLKKFFGIQIVAVAFYAPAGIPSDQVLLDCPKRLEVVYLQNVPKEELDRATFKGIKINVSKEEYDKLEPKIKLINNKYVDVRKGDKIIMDYSPHRGLHVFVNQQDKGIVMGSDIARAFFAIWVGDHPVDSRIKFSLLGGENV